jgi:hypothetical protein
MIYVLTFATHAEGNFNNMINNSYGIKIKVLGWGKKWTGFKMKYIYVYNFIKNLKDNDIIIFLDGFDVYINGYLKNAIKIFEKNNYKVLFSKEIPMYKINYFKNKVFNPYNEKYILNTGLYMGYVKYLKILLHESLKLKCNDDQRNMNILRNKYNFINIDINNEIFENIQYKNELKKSDSIFVQQPGTISKNRLKRSIYEYSQFFLKEIIFLITFLTFFILIKKSKLKIIILIILIIFYFFYKKIDKSCL